MRIFLSIAILFFTCKVSAQVTLNTTNGSTYSDSYSPVIEKIPKAVKKKICADSVIIRPREVLTGPCRKVVGYKTVYDTIYKVDLQVDRAPAYSGGFKKFKAGLNSGLKFTQKDVKYKDVSTYKIYVLIDDKGKVAGVEFVDGKKADNFYPRLVEQIFKMDNWKPATADGKPIPYKMPLVIQLKPSLEGRYVIDLAKPLTVNTVFEYTVWKK